MIKATNKTGPGVQTFTKNGFEIYRVVTTYQGKDLTKIFNPHTQYKDRSNPKRAALEAAEEFVITIRNKKKQKSLGSVFSKKTIAEGCDLLIEKKTEQHETPDGGLKKRSLDAIINRCGHIKDSVIANRLVKHTKLHTIKDLAKDLKKKQYSDASVQKICSVFKMMITQCMDPGTDAKDQPIDPWIDFNPCTEFTHKRNDEKPEIEIPSVEDVQKLVFHSPKFYQLLYLFMSTTGLRFSEVAGLTWDNVKYEQDQVWVRNIYDDETKALSSKLKTHNSKREVPLMTQLKKALLQWQADEDSHKELVFGFNGTFLNYNKVYNNLKDMKKLHDLDCGAVHSFRHFYASMLIEWNAKGLVSVKEIPVFLGHHSFDFTLKQYGHKFKQAGKWDNTVDSFSNEIGQTLKLSSN